jgi:Rieske Fe-S protein
MSPYVRQTSQPVSRRTAIMGAGVATLAVSGLTACGSESTPAAPASSAEAPSSAPPSSSGGGSAGGVTAKVADIPVGGGKIFADAKTVVTQPTAGEFKAFSAICTHKGCPVAEVTTTINCKCHGSKFNLTDGAPAEGPAENPLGAKTVQVEGDSITVSA